MENDGESLSACHGQQTDLIGDAKDVKNVFKLSGVTFTGM